MLLHVKVDYISITVVILHLFLEKAASSSTDGVIEGAMHPHVQCDGCNQRPIIGYRFKCVVCKDYDLCAKCESRGVHKEHDFIIIREPTTKKVNNQYMIIRVLAFLNCACDLSSCLQLLISRTDW